MNSRSVVAADVLTPADVYPDLIAARNDERGWGLTDKQIDAFAKEVRAKPHIDVLYPTAVTLRLGKGRQHDWYESLLWIQEWLASENKPFEQSGSCVSVQYLGGQELGGKSPELSVALLDLVTYQNWRKFGATPAKARDHRQLWPGMEIPWFLALNPEYYKKLGQTNWPYLWAPGLVARSNLMPVFGSNTNGVFVRSESPVYAWGGRTMPAFREE